MYLYGRPIILLLSLFISTIDSIAQRAVEVFPCRPLNGKRKIISLRGLRVFAVKHPPYTYILLSEFPDFSQSPVGQRGVGGQCHDVFEGGDSLFRLG